LLGVVDSWDETTEPDWFAMLNPPRTSRSSCSRVKPSLPMRCTPPLCMSLPCLSILCIAPPAPRVFSLHAVATSAQWCFAPLTVRPTAEPSRPSAPCVSAFRRMPGLRLRYGQTCTTQRSPWHKQGRCHRVPASRAEAFHRNSSCTCRCSARRTPTLSARAHGSVLLRPPNICTHRQLLRVTARTLAPPIRRRSRSLLHRPRTAPAPTRLRATVASSCTASRAAHESASHPHAASLLGTRASAPGPSRVPFLHDMRLHPPARTRSLLCTTMLLLPCTPEPHHLLPLTLCTSVMPEPCSFYSPPCAISATCSCPAPAAPQLAPACAAPALPTPASRTNRTARRARLLRCRPASGLTPALTRALRRSPRAWAALTPAPAARPPAPAAAPAWIRCRQPPPAPVAACPRVRLPARSPGPHAPCLGPPPAARLAPQRWPARPPAPVALRLLRAWLVRACAPGCQCSAAAAPRPPPRARRLPDLLPHGEEKRRQEKEMLLPPVEQDKIETAGEKRNRGEG
jgi:hypothetical protein